MISLKWRRPIVVCGGAGARLTGAQEGFTGHFCQDASTRSKKHVHRCVSLGIQEGPSLMEKCGARSRLALVTSNGQNLLRSSFSPLRPPYANPPPSHFAHLAVASPTPSPTRLAHSPQARSLAP